MAVITEMVSKQPAGTEAILIEFATAVLILSWIIGIVDAYRVGRFQDGGAGPAVQLGGQSDPSRDLHRLPAALRGYVFAPCHANDAQALDQLVPL